LQNQKFKIAGADFFLESAAYAWLLESVQNPNHRAHCEPTVEKKDKLVDSQVPLGFLFNLVLRQA